MKAGRPEADVYRPLLLLRLCRKAVRAIVVLFPLLGLTYLLMFYGPATDTELYRVFKYMNALLQTLQVSCSSAAEAEGLGDGKGGGGGECFKKTT